MVSSSPQHLVFIPLCSILSLREMCITSRAQNVGTRNKRIRTQDILSGPCLCSKYNLVHCKFMESDSNFKNLAIGSHESGLSECKIGRRMKLRCWVTVSGVSDSEPSFRQISVSQPSFFPENSRKRGLPCAAERLVFFCTTWWLQRARFSARFSAAVLHPSSRTFP